MFHLQFARTVSHYRFDHQNIEFRRICWSFDKGGMRKEGFELPRVMAFKFGFRKAELLNAKSSTSIQ
jgi:hypothetical protein